MAGGRIDGAERSVWATTTFLISPLLWSRTLLPLFFFFFFWLYRGVDSLSLPRCPREPLIAPLALSALPPCHRMPIAVGTHFKQSMAGVAKQSGSGLTAAMASVVSASGLFSTGCAANAFEKAAWRAFFEEYPSLQC